MTRASLPLQVVLVGPCGPGVSKSIQSAPNLHVCASDLTGAASSLPDAFIVDARTDGGPELVRLVRRRDLFAPLIAVVDEDDVNGAVRSIRAGATEYLSAQASGEQFALVISRAVNRAQNAQMARLARVSGERRYASLVGSSAPMQSLLHQLEGLEDVDAPTVLITGESGVGKDLVARAIHQHGPRFSRPFVEVDCAAMPEQLVESHLFGHERGAFTDAKELKRGLFELARGGTVFLDEIGELPLGAQAKLLRALENRRFKRVGGSVDLPLDAALISATNRDLREASRTVSFRRDLFYRINVVQLHVPPLRERIEDVPALVEHFVQRLNDTLKRSHEGVDRMGLRALGQYGWPGNIRELRNVIERAMILNHDSEWIQVGHLPAEIVDGMPAGPPQDATARTANAYELPAGGVNLAHLESEFVRQALERSGGNQTRAAALLGISRFALRHRAEKHGLAALISTKRGRPKGSPGS